MFKLTDFDVAPDVIDTDYISPAEILVPPTNEVEQVGMIRCCSCGNVIGGTATRIYDNLRDKINNYRHLTKSNPPEDLHAQFLREAEAAEPSISNLCCTIDYVFASNCGKQIWTLFFKSIFFSKGRHSWILLYQDNHFSLP